MISQIKGKLSYKGAGCAIVDVAGVGYKIYTPLDAVIDLKEGSEVIFWTHLVVKENALDIYGFIEKEEVDIFKLLIGVSGIGPKSALAILTIAGVDNLIAAVSSGEISYLTKISGIGNKNAQKIILELKDKIKSDKESVSSSHVKEDVDVIDALKSLGYSARDVREALKKIPDKNVDPGYKIKEVLKILGKNAR